jgi:GNAT superfamily N-acetyltransferase
METAEILALYDREERMEVEFPGVRREVLPEVVRFVAPSAHGNFVLYSRVDEGNVERVIQEQVEYFRSLGLPFEWKVYDYDRPADLRERLLAHGFETEEPEAIMVLDLQDVPVALLEPVTADVRRLTRREELEDVIEIEKQVWGEEFDWIREQLGADLERPGYLSVYVAYVEGQPACSGWTYYTPDGHFASLWGGSTLEAYRKRGLYTAVLAVRVQEAIERGYRFLTIDASEMSRPIVSRHGFRLLAWAYACKWKPEEDVKREA